MPNKTEEKQQENPSGVNQEKMNETQETVSKSALQEVLDSWEFMKLSEDKQMEYLREKLLPAMFQMFATSNEVEEVIVYEGISSLVVKCLSTASIPESLKTPELPEEAEEYFRGYCDSRIVRSVELEQLEVPNPKAVNPDGLFIRLKTKGDREQESLVRWGMESGYIGWLEQQPTKLLPSLQELRLVYFVSKYFEAVAIANQNRVKAASVSDLNTGIYRP